LRLGRALGGDGATTLFSHISLSRVVCEAAVRFAWVFDPEASPEKRIMHGAALLLASADERLRGAVGLPAGHFNENLRQALIKNCVEERDSIRALIARAGVRLVPPKKGKGIDRLELDSPKVVVKVRIKVTELMGDLLRESPGWYNLGSSIIHSLSQFHPGCDGLVTV
jgi:hypothetical protein